MAKKVKVKSYEDAVSWFRDHGFDVLEAPGTSGRVFLKKYNVSAAIERAADGGVKIFAYPGYLIGGEISKLVDHGYQKVLKDHEDGNSGHRRSPESAAPVRRGTEGRYRWHQPLQRVAGHGERGVQVRPGAKPGLAGG